MNTVREQTSSPNFTPVSFSHPISSKLNHENFLVWRKQVLATICGHRLHQFLFDSSSSPPWFLSRSDEEACIINQAFLEWEQQDQLILSWMLASVSDDILTRLVNCDSSAAVWKTLDVYFAAQVRAKVSQFKLQLQSLKKGSLSINEYLLKIRHCVDMLALVGNSLPEKDHIDAILDGLPPEYETFILSVNTRLDPYTVA